jgi:hypothetical protein
VQCAVVLGGFQVGATAVGAQPHHQQQDGCEQDLSGVNLQEKGGTAYKPTTIERKTEFGFSTGKPVFILDDPQGKSWVMKSAGLIVDPGQNFDQLKDLGGRLKPAPGWKFRVQVLEEDLILRPEAASPASCRTSWATPTTSPGQGTATTTVRCVATASAVISHHQPPQWRVARHISGHARPAGWPADLGQ